MRRKTLSIRCSRCGKELFTYIKIGKGNVWRCWKQRILTDDTIKKDKEVCCSCGNLVGIDVGVYIKIKQHHVTIR